MKYTTYFAIWLGAIFYNIYRELFVWDGTSRQGDGILNVFLCVVIGFVGMFPFYWINQKIEKSKAKKEAQEKEAADKKEQAESARASKKASEKRKKELIERYGEEDGMLIFKRKISEKNYKKKKELIQKYGEKFGNAVFNKTLEIGMSLEMFRDIFGEDVYLEVGNKFYVGKPFKYTVTFENGKLVSEKKISPIWQNMSKNMLVASWGNPENEKETVYKNVVKLKWFYGGRRTRQNTRVYKWRVDLENNRVVGWKELE